MQKLIEKSLSRLYQDADIREDEFSYQIALAAKKREKETKIGGKSYKVTMSPEKAEEILSKKKDESLDEKNQKRPGNPDYYRGTKKSNKRMSKEIEKCSKKPMPKSCYDYWSADKEYDKSKKQSEVDSMEEQTLEESIISIFEELLDEGKKKSRKVNSKVKETLKKKAEKSNMPLGALTSVYRKGLAAWLTGHRQGVPQHAWAMARVNSFIRGGKTRSVDKGEWKKVQKHRKK